MIISPSTCSARGSGALMETMTWLWWKAALSASSACPLPHVTRVMCFQRSYTLCVKEHGILKSAVLLDWVFLNSHKPPVSYRACEQTVRGRTDVVEVNLQANGQLKVFLFKVLNNVVTFHMLLILLSPFYDLWFLMFLFFHKGVKENKMLHGHVSCRSLCDT